MRRIPLWTWGGSYFGYLEDGDLWSCDGDHVAKLRGDAFFTPDGVYLCSIVDNRLRVDVTRKGMTSNTFAQYGPRPPEQTYQESRTRYIDRQGFADLPKPDGQQAV